VVVLPVADVDRAKEFYLSLGWRLDADFATDHHGPFEKTAPKHDWWDWYAAYMHAREHGSTPEEASAAAGNHMQQLSAVQGQS
jgi:catechol 2,3-dioxygenase-like lactoylglutathione lyase family enzyme